MVMRSVDYIPMMTNAFIGRTEPPDDEARAAALGPVSAIWDRLLADLARECGATTREWRCYSPKSGWSLRVKRKQRTIVWLSPCQDCFNVLFIFGAKAMERPARRGCRAEFLLSSTRRRATPRELACGWPSNRRASLKL